MQSAADPQHCRVAGPGVTKAVAGQRGELVIEVGAHAARRAGGACVLLWHGDTAGAQNACTAGRGQVTAPLSGGAVTRCARLVAGEAGRL